MPDADFRSTAVLAAGTGQRIALTDILFAADPTESDFAVAARADTLAQVIATIFRNGPTALTPTELAALRAIIDIYSEAEADTAAAGQAVLRYTDDEKTKLGILDPILDAGTGSQTSAQFQFPSFTGFDPTVGFPARGQFVVFTVDTIAVGTLGTSDVTIDFDGVVYTLTGLSTGAVPLEEFRPSTEYFALGRGLTDLILIGPNDLLEDDIIDVTGVGLPVLDIDNYNKLFIDHDTPRVWVGHREITTATPALGTFNDYVDSDFFGELSRDPRNPPTPGQHYYSTRNHTFRGYYFVASSIPPRIVWSNVSFGAIFGSDARWLGEQPDDPTAANLIQNFDSSFSYYVFDDATGMVELLDNSTYVAAVSREVSYDAEPISAPSGVGSISGVTAGIGLSGGGTSGVVSLSLDVSATDFPVIPISKGGTDATNSADARSNLGLGDAAERNVGDSVGNLASLKANGAFLARHIAPGGTAGQVLTKDSSVAGMAWEDAAAGSLNSVAHDGTLGGLGTTGNPLRIADNSITEGLIDASNAPTDDQVLTWDDVNDRLYWATPSGTGDITGVTAGNGLTGGGDSGSVTLDINVGLPSFPVITIDKGGTGATTAASARTQLGLGTASTLDSGAASGNVPVLDSSGHLSDSIIPSSVTFDTELESAISQHLANAVTGNTETGITVTYDTNEKFNFIVSGTTVHTNTQLTGDGTIANPVGIAANAIAEGNIDIGNVPQDTQVLSWDQANSRLIWKDDATSTPGSGLTAVSHSTEFTGTGEVSNPINLADDSILPTRLNFTNAPTDTYVVAYDSATLNFTWVANMGGGGAGDITGVVAGDGLSGGGDSGSVTLDIDVAETSFPIIPVAKGGTSAVTAGAARTNLGLNTAVTVISEVNGQLRIGYVDGSTFEIPLEPDGNFHGYGHMVEEGGDSFLRTPSGTTFAFGDFAVADDILYIHQRSAQTTGVQPDTIASLDHFSRIPVLDSANQIIPLQAIIAVDSRILDRLQNAPQSGVSFNDRVLTWDDSNPNQVGSTTWGTARNYTTANWAHPTSSALIPIDKLASGGSADQVLGWTATGQEWVDVTGSGVDTNNYTDTATLALSGSALTLTVGLTGSLADVVSNSITLPSGGGISVSAWNNFTTYGIGNIVTQNSRAFLSRTDGNLANDPDLEASAANWFLLRTGEEIVHTAGRFYAPGTVVNSTGGGADVFIARRPTTDTPSEFDADWYHLPRGATVLEATTVNSPYRSGTLVYIGGDMYFCHTSVPAPGVTAADIPGSADFVSMTSGGLTNVQHDDSFTGIGTLGSPLSLNVAGSTFPIIPVIKGGTGSATPTGARFTLGLGTAATRDIGITDGDVAELGTSGLFHSDRFAIGGTDGQVLTKTATGQAWVNVSGMGIDTNSYVDSASLSLSGSSLTLTLPRTGGLADVVSNSVTLPSASGGGVIVPTSVSHQGSNNFNITTGRGFSTIPVGTQILFQPSIVNTGGVRVNVDGTGNRNVNLANSPGAVEAIPSGLLTVNDSYILIWDHNNVEWGIHPLTFGLSAWYSTGTDVNEIPVLGTNGVLASGRLASGGSNEQVLTRTNSGQAWENPNLGNITQISVGFDNGLSGGGTTGTVNIGLSFSRLGTQNAIDGADNIAYGDTSNGSRMQRIALSNLVGFITDQSTLSSANSKIRIADEGIQEVHLDATNTPTDGQVLSSVGGGQFAWANSVGTQLYFPVPDSGVGGTANAITLTSGDSLSSYANGQRFFFSANSNNTGAVTVNVDGIAAISVQRSSGTGSSQALTGGEITADDPITVIYGSDDNAFYLLPDLQGTAARRNVGDSEHNVAVLQSDASFTAGHLAPGGTDTQVLTRTATGKAWMDVAGGGGGTGDITAVTTASGSGLSGGVTTGAADLALDIAGLTNLSSTALADNDILFLGDVSDAGDPRKHLTVGGLMSFATSGESTTESGGGKIRVATRGIDVMQMSITGTPATGQFISYDGSGMEWATPTGGGTAYTDADVDARIINRLQTATPGGTPDFTDTVLLWDGQLRSTRVGSIRAFTTLAWAQTNNNDLVPSDKLSSGGTPNQVLTRTATGQTWRDASGGGGPQAGSIATMSPVVLSSTVNVAHGLGREPDWISAYLECLTAEHGYAVGDRISAYNYNRSISGADSTNVWVSTQQTTLPYIVNKNGGNDLEITGANWSFFAVPYITDGSGMGGGTGDITAVNVGTGLTGGGDTGDVTINLDLNALPSLPAITINDRVIVIDASDSGAAKDQSIGDFASAMTTYLSLDALALESLIVATDNFMFSDTSNSNATRRVTWGGAIARMADQATLITANAVMRINDGGVDTNEVADEAVTEPKLDVTNAPTSGYVLGWNGTDLEWRAEGSPPPPLTHTRYFAIGADRTFVEADYTGGLSFTSDTFQIPTFTGDSYWAIAVPATNPITSIIALTTPQQDLTSQFTLESDLVIAGENHNIWISNGVYFGGGGQPMIRIS